MNRQNVFNTSWMFKTVICEFHIGFWDNPWTNMCSVTIRFAYIMTVKLFFDMLLLLFAFKIRSLFAIVHASYLVRQISLKFFIELEKQWDWTSSIDSNLLMYLFGKKDNISLTYASPWNTFVIFLFCFRISVRYEKKTIAIHHHNFK